ncbi:MAG: hypothetical protein ACLPLP_21430 [Mycobacterium sp.]
MSTPSAQDDSGTPVCSALISGTSAALTDLVSTAGVSIVHGTVTDDGDGQSSVVVYASPDTVNALGTAGYGVVVLSDPDTLQAQWDAVQEQVDN